MLVHAHLPDHAAVALVGPDYNLRSAQRFVVGRNCLALADVIGSAHKGAAESMAAFAAAGAAVSAAAAIEDTACTTCS